MSYFSLYMYTENSETIKKFIIFLIYNNKTMTDNLYIAAITGPDIQNGTGVRLTIWIQGCKHNCPDCHNGHLQSYKKDGNLTTEQAFKYIEDELIRTTENGEYIYDGVTFSGGDPLFQTKTALEQLKELISQIRDIRPEINVWIYTGFTFSYLYKENKFYHEYIEQIMPDVIVDGKFMQHYKPTDPNTLPFRGSSNQHIVDVKASYGQGSLIEINLKNQ